MASSYDRIVTNYLAPHKETREFVENFPEHLKEAEIVGHSFAVDRHEGRITSSLRCRFGVKPEEEPEEGAAPTYWEVNFHEGRAGSPHREVTESFCHSLLERVWGTPKVCPTFNCGKDGVSHRFTSQIVGEVWTKHKDLIETEMGRVQGLATAYMASEQFLTEKQTQLERGGIDEIVAAMERFSTVSEDVVRDAVEEYLAKRVVNE